MAACGGTWQIGVPVIQDPLMTIRDIVQFPDSRLRTKCEAVTAFDADLQALAQDLEDSMIEAEGIGIAGPHIGVLKRVMVLKMTPEEPATAYVNPEVTWTSKETRKQYEGSISLPNTGDEVERPAKVKVRYQDLAGASREIEADGLLAACLQHEIDQLDGIFWTSKLSRLKRERVMKRAEKVTRLQGYAAERAAAQQAEEEAE